MSVVGPLRRGIRRICRLFRDGQVGDERVDRSVRRQGQEGVTSPRAMRISEVRLVAFRIRRGRRVVHGDLVGRRGRSKGSRSECWPRSDQRQEGEGGDGRPRWARQHRATVRSGTSSVEAIASRQAERVREANVDEGVVRSKGEGETSDFELDRRRQSRPPLARRQTHVAPLACLPLLQRTHVARRTSGILDSSESGR